MIFTYIAASYPATLMTSASLVFHAGASQPKILSEMARGFPALSVLSTNLNKRHSSNKTGLSIYQMWSWLPTDEIASCSSNSIKLLCPIDTCAPLSINYQKKSQENISKGAVSEGFGQWWRNQDFAWRTTSCQVMIAQNCFLFQMAPDRIETRAH